MTRMPRMRNTIYPRLSCNPRSKLVLFNPLLHFFQQGEILVTREAGRLEVAANNKHRNFLVSRNDHRAGHARLHVGAMAALLAGEPKSGGEEDGFHRAPMLRGEPGHGRS